jgi:hypothetical protein
MGIRFFFIHSMSWRMSSGTSVGLPGSLSSFGSKGSFLPPGRSSLPAMVRLSGSGTVTVITTFPGGAFSTT